MEKYIRDVCPEKGMDDNILVYLKNCEYARAIMSYLVLGNHWEPKTAVRLNKLNKKVKEIRGHTTKTGFYEALRTLEEMQVIRRIKRTVTGVKIPKDSTSRSNITGIHLELSNFSEPMGMWCTSLGYDGFGDMLRKNGYPGKLNIIKTCQTLTKDGCTYLLAPPKTEASLIMFT